jgi:hypothetical protein
MPKIDTGLANVARAWNYMVGGKDNFKVDREAARQLMEVAPVIRIAAPASRAFLRRAVRYLADDAGIRQFLDIGTGLPSAGNTHEIAQSVGPECRVVYVDNDPVVLVHARALLISDPGSAGISSPPSR